MSVYLRPIWLLRLSALFLVWGLLSGYAVNPLLAGADEAVPQPVETPSPPIATPFSAGERNTTAPDAIWAVWERLAPDLQAKVDERILDELRGKALPAHLGGQPFPSPDESELLLSPRQQTRFIIYLHDTADLSAVHERIYASQADKRRALVDTLRATAEASQEGVVRILAAGSVERQNGPASVAGFQPLFIVNGVAAEADLATISELAQQPEVSKIVANYPLYPIMREVGEPAGTSPRPETEQVEDQVEERAADGGVYDWNLQKVQADRVHRELGVRGAGAVVGGFDTGVNFRHPALLRQYRGNENGVIDHNYNWFVPDGDLYPDGNLGKSVTTRPTDCAYSSHGTHTMGTMVGEEKDNAPTIGMAPDARWIAVPGICGATMSGGIRDDIGGIKAFQWFLCPTDLSGELASADCSKAPDVVNNSWGSSNPTDDTFRPIIQVLRAAGIAAVFAAGNPSAGRGSIGTPANIPEAITVSATDDNDNLTYFSALGPSLYPGEQKPELSAPGSWVSSSVGSAGYNRYSGTSMSAPHVAGLIALLVSVDLRDGIRDFDVDELERLMAASAEDLGVPGPDPAFGYGRINAFAAVQLGLTAGDLRGQIFDAEYGTPVPLIHIQAYQAEMDKEFVSQADASGHYSLTVPAGDYQVTLSGWGYETTFVGTHKVVDGALSLVDFSLLSRPRAMVSGTVRDGNGPVANALIYPAGDPSLQVHSDRNGNYGISLPLGPDELIVEAPGHRVVREPVQTPGVGTQLHFVLQSAPSILLVDTSPLGGWFFGWPVYRFFTRALDEQGYQYDLWRIQSSDFSGMQAGIDGSTRYGLPSATTLKSYSVVIWVQSSCNDARCYDRSTADIGADPALAEFLDSGGRLFISGQDMGYGDHLSVLYDNYLQADHYSNYGGYTGQTVTGSDFLQSFRMPLTNGALYGYPNSYLGPSPDAVVPQPGGVAFPVMSYPNGQSAALAVAPCDADYRALYLAAGYENLAPRAHQVQEGWTDLLRVSIEWLVSNTSESRYSLSSDYQFNSGKAGSNVSYAFSVANLGDQPMRVAINVDGNNWPTTVLLRDIPVVAPVELPPCSRTAFELRVTVPYAAEVSAHDEAVLLVTSPSNPSLPVNERTFVTMHRPQWDTAEPLPSGRSAMSTIGRDNGYHLIGGWVPSHYDPDTDLFVPENAIAEHLRFDPCQATWEVRSPLPEPRRFAAYAAIGEHFYVAGGEYLVNDEFAIADTLFIYDNTTDSWTQGARLPHPLIGATGAAVGGKFYVFGGGDYLEGSTHYYAYDPAIDQWQDLGEIEMTPFFGAASAVVKGMVYLLDGSSGTAVFARYDPATNIWQRLPVSSSYRLGASLVAAPDGYLYLVGGGTSVVERFHVDTRTWSFVNYTNTSGRFFSGAAYMDGQLYLAGGSSFSNTSQESLKLAGSFCESALVNEQSAVGEGGQIVYTLDLYPGDRAYPNVQMSAPLDQNQTFVEFGENGVGATYNGATHRVEWAGQLPANAAPIRLAYTVGMNDGAWQIGDRVIHTVHLDSGHTLSMSRNSTTQLFAPDFSTSRKGLSHSSVSAGTPFTYTVDLRNKEPVGGAISFIDPLPSELDYVAGSLIVGAGTGSYDPSTHSILWQGQVGFEHPGIVNLGTKYVWADTLGDRAKPMPEFAWQDIRTTGVSVASGSDSITCDLPLDFAFPFFGDEYTKVCVDVNGYVTFREAGYPNSYNICPLSTNSSVAPGIAGLWASLAVEDGVYMQTFGTAPERYTIFQWTDAHLWYYYEEFYGIQRPPDTDFQIIIHENGQIQLHILRLGSTLTHLSTIGLASPHPNQGVTYRCNAGDVQLRDRMTVEFLPPGGILPSSGEQVSFQMTAKDDLPVNSIITNTVIVQSNQATITRTASLVVQSVDLTTSTKVASPKELLPGESVVYTVTMTNRGLAVAEKSILSDTLPVELTYVADSLHCGSGLCSEEGGVIAWQGEISPGGAVSLTYRARLNTVLPDRTMLTNTAEIRSTGVSDLQRSAVVYARSTNLSASLFDFGDKPVEPGDRFALTALLRNTGVQSAVADFSLALPPELTYIPDTLYCGVGNCRIESGKILWSGTMPPRGLVAVRMEVQLATGLASGQPIEVRGEMVDHTWGLTQQVTSVLFVAFHTMAPAIEGLGIEPPLFLPWVQRRRSTTIPATPVPMPTFVSPLPTPTAPVFTPVPVPTLVPVPTPTPTPAGR